MQQFEQPSRRRGPRQPLPGRLTLMRCGVSDVPSRNDDNLLANCFQARCCQSYSVDRGTRVACLDAVEGGRIRSRSPVCMRPYRGSPVTSSTGIAAAVVGRRAWIRPGCYRLSSSSVGAPADVRATGWVGRCALSGDHARGPGGREPVTGSPLAHPQSTDTWTGQSWPVRWAGLTVLPRAAFGSAQPRE